MKKLMNVCALVSALLAVSLCLTLTSCVGISAAELSAGYTRTATDTGAESDVFYTAMTDFAFALLGKTLDPDGKSTLISPYSVAMCLGMLTNGAEGETKKQLEELLGMDADELNRALYASAARLCGKDRQLKNADSVWFRKGAIDVKKDFLQTNADWYGAGVYSAPFDGSTVRDINNWCAKHTDGMIDKIIDRIDDNTLMYLINAVCFDAKWEEKYENSDIRDSHFTNRDGSGASVKMLRSKGEKYISSDNAEGFIKNYEGGSFGFVGLLPRDAATDIYDFARSIDGAAWRALWQGRGGSANAGIPEFGFEYEIILNDALGELGVTDVFDSEKADLGGISDMPTYCSRTGHKTFIELDRNGTRAAAITWGAVDGESAEIAHNIILDRPFVCMIVDNESGIPVFVGVVTDLSA